MRHEWTTIERHTEDLLARLQKEGCYPSISWRGNCWRAHVNAAGNYWGEAGDPHKALTNAVELWEGAGRPMDGYANIQS